MGAERDELGLRTLRASAWRFALAGGANTVLTAALLAALAQIIDRRVAYTIVFGLGVALAVYLADRVVFGVRLHRRGLLEFGVLYLAVYLVGLGVVAALERHGAPRPATALVVVVTAPLTFLGGRLIARRAARPDKESR